MSAVTAMESLCGVEVDGQLRALRRLLYCGEWIESHALHVFMLHAPDFLGFDERRRDGARPPDVVADALDAEEGRQRGDARRSAAARSTRSTCASAASTARRARRELATLVERLERGREIALGAVTPDRRRSTSPTTSRTSSSSRSPSPASTRSTAAAIVSDRGLDIRRAEYPTTSSSTTCRGRTRCTRSAATAAATWSARSPASRPATTS